MTLNDLNVLEQVTEIIAMQRTRAPPMTAYDLQLRLRVSACYVFPEVCAGAREGVA